MKRRNAPKAAYSRSSLAASKETNVARLARERDEAREQQTATADVLKVISRSAFNLQTVLDTLVELAARLCNADSASIYRPQGEACPCIASYGLSPEFQQYLRDHPIARGRGSVLGRVVSEGKIIHVPDVLADAEHALVEQRKLGGYRTVLGVPLRREGEAIGLIRLTRNKVQPFTDKQIELVTTFADQAVIAIENTRLLSELRQRTNDLSESLEQQTATSEVLKVISSSAGELQPVFETMLAKAVELCEASFGAMWLVDGEGYRTAALHGDLPEAYVEQWRSGTLHRPKADVPMVRAIRSRKPVHVTDMLKDTAYLEGDPLPVSVVEIAGIRTLLTVPMLKESEAVGVITIYRKEVRAFSDKQIELVTNFAAQAVIAIENTRLLNELRQRTDDLSQSLDRQTAMSEVLGVISSSPTDLTPVFDTILANATRLCEGNLAALWRYDGESLLGAAQYNASAEFVKHYMGMKLQPGRSGPARLAALERRTVHVADITGEPGFSPMVLQYERARTVLAVPLLREKDLVGVIAIWRREVRPFTEQQIALVRTFADQAVIAIENARLLNELRESLQQQTATADVLKVISRSTFDLQTVLDTLVELAARLCGAEMANIWRPKDGVYRLTASYGVTTRYKEYLENKEFLKTVAIESGRGTVAGRALLERKTVHVHDIQDEADYNLSGLVALGGYRTMLGVPMLREGVPIGVIALVQTTVRPFTDKQIELATTFADQAVIAIENVRLFEEVQARTRELAQSVDELQALGEVSQAVNSTLDLETVLTTIVGRAVQLSRTDAGAIYVFDEGRKEFRLHATYGMSEAMIAAIADQHLGLDNANIGAAATQRRPIQFSDIRDAGASVINEIILREGYRSLLIVPLLRPDNIVGALVVRRKTPGEFPKSTIELLQTFADQSVVAIQNARLFESVEARTRELAKSLEALRTTQDRLVQTQKLASLGQLTAGIAHEMKNPLNFVNNFSVVSSELIDELRDTLKRPLDDKARAEINELTDTLRGNLDKVVQHGKRADAIVKNMLLHSREGSGEHRVVDINTIVEESLNLAYHGARAEKQGFTITLERSLDPAAGAADVFPQDITRALLNLISNGFYAATKRKAEVNGGDYEPTLAATTKNLGDRVEIRIRDNGTGIPPEVKEKMFNPFFTTKPAGEGTGLGLSISHDIIVKQHGGSIEVDTQPGEFTELRIILPRAAVFQLSAP